MTVYSIRARCVGQPVAAGWREQLAVRLGSRPRRLGRWAELGMYGALECLASGVESTLAPHDALILSSQHGPIQAVRSAMAQACEDLPLPLTFLQTQPSQLLAALSAQLQWCGDARFITHSDPLVLLAWTMALADGHAGGLLVGWVDDLKAESSVWLRLQAAVDPSGIWVPARDFPTLLHSASYVRSGQLGLEVIIGSQHDHTDQIY